MKEAINQIIETVANEFGITPEALRGATRVESIVIPRMTAMELVWKHCGVTYNTVAHHFGKRDHGTVLHARKRVYALLETNTAFANAYRNIESNLNL